MNKGLIAVIHFILILVALLSPILFSWWLILVGAIILWIQYYVVGSCILTHKQFGKKDNDMTFWYYMLKKSVFKPNKKKVKFVVRNIIPVVLILLAVIFQVIFEFRPFLF